jgi:capsular polysaccharide biosynthesis protein
MNVHTPYAGMQPGMSASPPPMPPAPSPREKIARLKTLAGRALQRWKVGLVILVIGFAASFQAGMATKLTYRSECTILFKAAIRTGERNSDDGQSERAQRVGMKLKDLLVTRTRLESIIKEFKLYPKIVDGRGMVEAVDEMRTHVGFRARDSETFVISFENEVPDIARQVTESLAESVINEFASTNLSTAKQEVDFLFKQEQRSAVDFENANKALATFLTLHPEFAVEAKTSAFGGAAAAGGAAGGGGASAPTMNVARDPSMGDPQLGVLYRQKTRLEAEVRNNSTAGATPDQPAAPLGGETVGKLTVQRDTAAKAAAAAAADLAEKRTRLTDEHPDVISAKLAADAAARQLHQTEVALAAAQARQAGGAPNPYDTPAGDSSVQRKIAQLNADIAARQDALRHAQPQAASDGGKSAIAAFGETNELVQLETQWQGMLSTLASARSEHDDIKQRLERSRLSASATEASGTDQMMVVDPAFKPLHPSKGGRTKTALMGAVVTLILALSYAFGRVLFSDTLIDSADIEALHVIPVLGVLPKVRPSNPPAAKGAGAAAQKEMKRVG